MSVMPEPAQTLSINAFAKRLGVGIDQVQKALRSGRLERSVGTNAKGKPVIADVALAELEWKTNDARHPKSGGLTTIAKERQALIQAQRRKIELHIRERRADLVDRRKVEIRFATRVVTARTKLLALPTRMKQRVPHLTTADLALVEEIIREALEELVDDAR